MILRGRAAGPAGPEAREGPCPCVRHLCYVYHVITSYCTVGTVPYPALVLTYFTSIGVLNRVYTLYMRVCSMLICLHVITPCTMYDNTNPACLNQDDC